MVVRWENYLHYGEYKNAEFTVDTTESSDGERLIIPIKCSNSALYVINVFDDSGSQLKQSYEISNAGTGTFCIWKESSTPNSKSFNYETVEGTAGYNWGEDVVAYLTIWNPSGSYKINIECIGESGQNLHDSIEKYNERYATEEKDPECYEKLLSYFILSIGEGLKWLISLMIPENGKLSIDAVIFDRYSATTLTLFSADDGYYENVNLLFGEGAAKGLNKIFGEFQKIAATIYVVILVYMGIRVLLISTADKKAKFKQLLVDWVKGVAILFLFPYVIRYAILLNHGIVDYIYQKTDGVLANNSPGIEHKDGEMSSRTWRSRGR